MAPWLWIVMSLVILAEGFGTRHMEVDTEDTPPTQKLSQGTRPFSFSKHFNHHMVLQRAPARAVVHGFSPAVGHTVFVQMVVGSTPYYYTTHVTKSPDGDGGVWRVSLDPVEAGTTVKITAISEFGALVLDDVIFGDVWICSGQSNMQFTVSMMFGAKEEIATARNYPNIRLMTVAQVDSTIPLIDLPAVEQHWTRPDATSVGGGNWTYFSAVCWVYGKAIHEATSIPIGLLASSWSGTPVGGWSSPDALRQCGVNGSHIVNEDGQEEGDSAVAVDATKKIDYSPQNNSVLWNSMIHPLLPMPIYGAIWYQGETDGEKAVLRNRYNCTFPAMIADWREKFHSASQGITDPTFPFGFVQLAPNGPEPASRKKFPEIRWHQTADYGYVPNPKMPRVFMAVAMDLPDFNSTFESIHPRDKKDVGSRLALSGRAIAYKQNVVFQGPLPVKGHVAPGAIVLDYGSSWQLDVRNYQGFDLFCSNSGKQGTWNPTIITSFTKTTITIVISVCSAGEQPTRLRYAWRESPCDFKQCAVYSTVNSLPGPPFIADLVNGHNGSLVADFHISVVV